MQTEAMEGIRNIAIYARVSTTNQEEEQTVKAQLMALEEYAREHDLEIVKRYIDDGWSGDILARPALDSMRDDATGNLWQGVLIYDPDRLARRYSYQELLMDEFKEKRKEILFVTVSTPKNSEDKILQGVRGLFAEYERAKIAERFRLGKLRKIKEGNIIVSEPNYGYTRIPRDGNKEGYYKINEYEAEVVRQIFMWVAYEGLTIRKVIQRLQELKIPPRKSKRGVWSNSTIGRILRNTCYIGKAKWGSTKAVVPKKPLKQTKYKKCKKSSRIITPKEEWLFVPVPAIIDKDLFQATQKQLAINARLSNRNKKNKYLLSGILRCSCGHTRAGEGVQNGKHLYYRCTDRVSSYPLPPACRLKGVNARALDAHVWENVAQLMSDPQLILDQVKRWDKDEKTDAKKKMEIESLNKQKSKIEVQKDRYYKAYAEGLIALHKLKEYIDDMDTKTEALNNRLEIIGNERKEHKAVPPTAEEARVFAKEAGMALKNLSFERKRRIILLVVEKVIASPLSANVTGHIPVKNVELLTDDRYSQDTIQHSDTNESVGFSLEINISNQIHYAKKRKAA